MIKIEEIDLDSELVEFTEEVPQELAVEIQKQKRLEVAREQIPFDKLMEMSMMLAKSTIVPVMYQNRPENVFVAMDLASRMGVSPLMVMQNLYVIQGKPSWSGQAVASLLRATPMFKNVELHYVGNPKLDDWGAYVTATRVSNGQPLKGATVTMAIAKKEGWYQKSGSKWQTTPELMLAYRAYTWFGRVHAPELLMGLQSEDEVLDTVSEKLTVVNPYEGSK